MNQALSKICLISFVCVAFSSCGTIINGTRQDVSIASNPPGALVTDGNETWRTPSKIRLSRKHPTVLTISKPGYETRTVIVNREFSAWAVVNVIPFLSPVGVGIDACTGGLWKLAPEAITCELQPMPITQKEAPLKQTEISTKETPFQEHEKTDNNKG
jgi:hypothetical protein